MTVKHKAQTTQSGYGLRHIKYGRLLTFSCRPTERGCDGPSEIYELSYCSGGSEPIWVVEDKLSASLARVHTPVWYACSYDAPMNPYSPEELEVVKVEIQTNLEEPSDIPTELEYLAQRYNDPRLRSYQPQHYEYVLSEMAKWPHRYEKTHYSIGELKMLRWDQEAADKVDYDK